MTPDRIVILLPKGREAKKKKVGRIMKKEMRESIKVVMMITMVKTKITIRGGKGRKKMGNGDIRRIIRIDIMIITDSTRIQGKTNMRKSIIGMALRRIAKIKIDHSKEKSMRIEDMRRAKNMIDMIGTIGLTSTTKVKNLRSIKNTTNMRGSMAINMTNMRDKSMKTRTNTKNTTDTKKKISIIRTIMINKNMGNIKKKKGSIIGKENTKSRIIETEIIEIKKKDTKNQNEIPIEINIRNTRKTTPKNMKKIPNINVGKGTSRIIEGIKMIDKRGFKKERAPKNGDIAAVINPRIVKKVGAEVVKRNKKMGRIRVTVIIDLYRHLMGRYHCWVMNCAKEFRNCFVI